MQKKVKALKGFRKRASRKGVDFGHMTAQGRKSGPNLSIKVRAMIAATIVATIVQCNDRKLQGRFYARLQTCNFVFASARCFWAQESYYIIFTIARGVYARKQFK